MIDFRYHLVSIVAVFLALAIGIVVGSTALKPAVLSGLQRTTAQERKQIDGLIAQNAGLKQQRDAAQQFAASSEHLLLHGLLDGQRVVLVEAPGAPGGVTTGVSAALTQAGAVVTGQLQVQQQFFSTGTQATLDTLNHQLTPAGVTLDTVTAQAQAAELIASAIMTSAPAGQFPVGTSDSVDAAILNGYAAGGFLSISSGKLTARATLAVVIIPASPVSTSDTNTEAQNLVTLAQQLSLAGSGSVLAGQLTGSGPGSAIDVLRTSGQAGHVSSVDDADYTTGQIVVAQTLYQQLSSGRPGNYGSLPGASSGGPEPGPGPVADHVGDGHVEQQASVRPGPRHRTGRQPGHQHRGELPVTRWRPAAALAGAGLARRGGPRRLPAAAAAPTGRCGPLGADQPPGRAGHAAGRPGRGGGCRAGRDRRARSAGPGPGRPGGRRGRRRAPSAATTTWRAAAAGAASAVTSARSRTAR